MVDAEKLSLIRSLSDVEKKQNWAMTLFSVEGFPSVHCLMTKPGGGCSWVTPELNPEREANVNLGKLVDDLETGEVVVLRTNRHLVNKFRQD